MLKIAICDDEKIINKELENIIEAFKINTDFEIKYKSFTNTKDIISDINSGLAFDLIFLDIELGEDSGIDFAKYLRNQLNIYTTKIVFITAKESYMKDVFECEALRFIRKPVEKEKIYEAIRYVIKSKAKENEVFVYKENDEMKLIPYDEIVYITSKHRKLEVICKYEMVECNRQLCDVEKVFISNKFVKISRSVMVNILYCKKIKENKLGIVIIYDILKALMENTIKNIYSTEKIKYYKNEIAIIKKSNENTNKVKQDLKNHLHSINILSREQKHKELNNYINNLEIKIIVR